MATKNIKWNIGEGYIHLSQESGEGGATVSISSDANSGGGRSQEIEFIATAADGTQVTKILTVHQQGALGYDGQWASTPNADYVLALDCENANSTYDASVDVLADGGSANIQ